jgi:hypothetical protein
MSLGTDTLATYLQRGLYQRVLVVVKPCALLDGVAVKLINFEQVLDQTQWLKCVLRCIMHAIGKCVESKWCVKCACDVLQR